MILKQSTAATVVVGPVLDSSGAAVTTAVTANFSLSKNGTVAALTSETVTHSTNGYYTIALTTSNTDTLGRVEIIVNDSAMSMATHRYNVIVGTSYDLLVTSGGYSTLDAAGIRTAVGLVSANLDNQLSTIDTVVDNIEEDTQDIQSRLPESLAFGHMPAYLYGCTASGGDQISVRIATNIVNKSFNWPDAVDEIAGEVWDEPLTGATHNVSTSAGRRLRQLGDTVILKDGETVAADNAGVINGSNGLGRIKLQPDVGTVCVGQAVRVAGMVRFIEAYDADTQYATVDAPWCTIPEVGDEYTIFNLRTSLIQRITSAASGTIAFVLAKLWEMIEDVSGYRFTADALEEAPTGGGGGGTGSFTVTLTIKDNTGVVVPECDVSLTTSNTGSTSGLVAVGRTNANGVVSFQLDAGTYYGWRQKSGFRFTNPFTMVVADDGGVTIS